jgi:hypothetical protein
MASADPQQEHLGQKKVCQQQFKDQERHVSMESGLSVNQQINKLNVH